MIVLRHRPSILPIISAWKHGKEKAEAISASKMPRTGNNKAAYLLCYDLVIIILTIFWVNFMYILDMLNDRNVVLTIDIILILSMMAEDQIFIFHLL
ncbi:MAG: hypothetical protein IPG00_03010 [Saprospiraceae bacterium]|nr:hypothetical protein [Saprospiraceae bacterium]